MDNTTYIALSRMDADLRSISVLANNIANASTAGFKAGHMQFSAYLAKQNGTSSPTEKTEAYTEDRATWRDFRQGTLQQTGNPLDVAITGEGFFSVMTPRGVRLSRNGRFQRLNNGQISDASGNTLLDQNGQPLVIPPRDVSISVASDGTISSENGVIGQIGVVTVDNLLTLSEEDAQTFRATTPTRQLQKRDIRQGMLEASNVDAMTETSHLLELQRDFQITSNLIDSESTRRKTAIDKILQIQS